MTKYVTITKADLIQLGYRPTHASRIIQAAKQRLVRQGLKWYSGKGIDRVPVEAVDAVLGLHLSSIEGEVNGQFAVKEEQS